MCPSTEGELVTTVALNVNDVDGETLNFCYLMSLPTQLFECCVSTGTKSLRCENHEIRIIYPKKNVFLSDLVSMSILCNIESIRAEGYELFCSENVTIC